MAKPTQFGDSAKLSRLSHAAKVQKVVPASLRFTMPLTTIKQWEQNFRAAGLKEELIQVNLDYLGPLLNQGLPVIFDFEHLSLLLGRTRNFLAKVVNAPESFYREFKIPKRSGGIRTIAAPYPSLLECQRWINQNHWRPAP